MSLSVALVAGGLRAGRAGPAPGRHGGPKPVVALVNVAKSPTERQAEEILELYGLLETAKAQTGWDPITDLVIRRLLAGSCRDWPLEGARRALEAGRLAQAALKLDDAVRLLSRAERLLLQRVSTQQARPLLVQVWASMVAAYHAAGEQDQAARAAARLALVAPDGGPLPKALWSRYRPQPAALPKPAVLEVTAPAKAAVWLNFEQVTQGTEPSARPPSGQPRGPAPEPERAPRGPRPVPAGTGAAGPATRTLRLRVTTSPVHLAVEVPGRTRYYALVALQPGQTRHITVTLQPRPKGPHAELARWWFETLRKGVGPTQLQQLGWKIHADFLIVTDSSDRASGYRLFRVDTGTYHVKASRRLTPAVLSTWAARPKMSPRQLARATARAVAATAKPRPVPAKPAHKSKKARPLWKRWYFWVAIGAVVVAATAFAVTQRNQDQQEVEIRVVRP